MGSAFSSYADRLPFRDPALPLDKRVDGLLGRFTLDERIALPHRYAPSAERLGVASLRTGTEALHGVAWLGEATVFPQAVGPGTTWDEDLVHEVAMAVPVEMRAFHVVPEALTELLCGLHARYPKLPTVWITENGSAEADTVGPDGQVHDTASIEPPRGPPRRRGRRRRRRGRRARLLRLVAAGQLRVGAVTANASASSASTTTP